MMFFAWGDNTMSNPGGSDTTHRVLNKPQEPLVTHFLKVKAPHYFLF